MIVGVLGAGQLGRMLALAGYPLGLRFRFLDPTPDAPASHVAQQLAGPYDDAATLDRFADGLDVITYEFENVPIDAARTLAARVPVFPPPEALEVSQDRLSEKDLFGLFGIPTPAYEAVRTREQLDAAVERIGLPAVLKTRRMGYDGKGQYALQVRADVGRSWDELGGAPLILEAYVPFERELSILGVRGREGEVAFYPLVQNEHRGGILRRSLAPAPDISRELQAQAEALAGRVMEALGYVGVLALELFQTPNGLVANEMAPRVHNSGHWTIEGAQTSQFENHLRAVVGLPLGATAARGHSAMLNLIGSVPDVANVLRVPGAHLHLYGKQPRPGRKLGHITVRADESATVQERAALLGGSG